MSKDSPLKVKLCEKRGDTSVFISAEITDEGHLLLSGQDVGEAPQEYWGDSDYEYWLVVAPQDKDRVLLALLEKQYSGNTRAITELMGLLKARSIPYEFDSYA